MNIYISDENREHAIMLKQCLKKILAVKKIDASILALHPEQMKTYEFNKKSINIIFMELVFEKSGLNGVALAESVRKRDFQPVFVFNSAHMEMIPFLLKGSVIPAGFLKKPAQPAEVEEIMENLMAIYAEKNDEHILVFSVDYQKRKLPYSQIIYFEALNKKIHIHTLSKRYSFYYSLAALEEELKGAFIRCHNSFLLNVKRIRHVSLAEMLIIMDNDAQIPISRGFKADIQESFPDI